MVEFQFHKGAIRTGEAKRSLPGNRNFNSIKVRLERSSGGSSTPPPRFQFHKGAIRTRLTTVKEIGINLISIP